VNYYCAFTICNSFSPHGADYRLKAHLVSFLPHFLLLLLRMYPLFMMCDGMVITDQSHKLSTLFTWPQQKLMGRLQALEDFRALMYRFGLPPRHLDPLTTQQSMIRI
jgi:hypothetical protein